MKTTLKLITTCLDTGKRIIITGVLLLLSHLAMSQTNYSVTWLDSDIDGNIDQLQFDFSETVDFTDADGASGTLDCFSLSIGTIVSAIDFSTVTGVSTFTVDVGGITGTSPGSTVTYVTGGQTSVVGQTNGEIANGSAPNVVTDGALPVLISSTPADDLVDVWVAQNLVLNFSEDLALGTGNFDLVNVSGPDDRTIAAMDVTQVSVTNNVVTVDLAADLLYSSDYSIQIDADAIEDLSANAFSGIGDNVTLNFRTVPTIVAGHLFDMDGNGEMDELVVELSEEVDETTAVATEFNLINGTLSPAVLSTGASNSLDANDNDAYVTFPLSAYSGGTGITGSTLSYTAGTLEAATGGKPLTQAIINLVDSAVPQIISLVPNPALITDADAGSGNFSIAVTYSETLDVGSLVTIDFPAENPLSTLVSPSGVFSTTSFTNDTYTVAYDVTDADDFIQNIDIRTSGATDLSANAAATEILVDQFNIDMAPLPTISSAAWLDQDNNGLIDAVTLTFGANVNITDVSAADGFDAVQISNGAVVSIDNADYTNTNVGSLTLEFFGDEISGTAITGLSVLYNTSGASIITAFSSGKEIANGEIPGAYIDAAAPAIISSFIHPSNSYLQFSFSEPINDVGDGDVTISDFNILPTLSTGGLSVTPTDIQNTSGASLTAAYLPEFTLRVMLDLTPSLNTATALDFLRVEILSVGNTIEDAAGNAAIGSTGDQPFTNISGVTEIISAVPAADNTYIELIFNTDVVREGSTDNPIRLANTMANGQISVAQWSNGSSDCTSDELCANYNDGGSGVLVGDDQPFDIEWVKADDSPVNDADVYISDTYRIYINDVSAPFTGTESYTFSAINDASIKGAANNVYMQRSSDFQVFFNDLAPDDFGLGSAIAFDVDQDGNLDEIAVVMSDDVADGSILPSEFIYDGTPASGVVGSPTNGVDPGIANDNVFTLRFDVPGTAVLSNLSFVGPTLTDDNGNATLTGSLSPDDFASPVVTLAETYDNDQNGQLDEIRLSLSEPVTGGGMPADYVISSPTYSVSGVTHPLGGNADQIGLTLTEAFTPDTYILPDISVLANVFTDADGNTNLAQNVANLSDKAAPFVEVDFVTTGNASLNLTGNVDDPDAIVLVSIVGLPDIRVANNDGVGNWSIATPITVTEPGTYDVQVEAFDLSGNTGNDFTVDEVTVTTANAVSILAPGVTACQGASFVPLGAITITENGADNFTSNGSNNLLLSLPSNYSFNTSVTPTYTGAFPELGPVSHNYLGSGVLEIIVPVGGTALIDELTISGLEVSATSSAVNGSLVRAGGDLKIFGANSNGTVFANLTTGSLPIAPSVEQGGTPVTQIRRKPGDPFELDILDVGGAVSNYWTDGIDTFIEPLSGASNEVDFNTNLGTTVNTNNVGVYEVFYGANDGACQSVPESFLIGVFDFFNDVGRTSFEVSEAAVTITADVPSGFTPTLVGPGVGGTSIGAGQITASFTPSAAGAGNHTITYTLDNGFISFIYQVVYEVNSASNAIFSNVVPTEYCNEPLAPRQVLNAEVADINAENFVFIGFACVNEEGLPCPTGVLEPPSGYVEPGFGTPIIDGASVIPTWGFPNGTTDGWEFNPFINPTWSFPNREFRIIRLGGRVNQPRTDRVGLGQVLMEVNPLPDVILDPNGQIPGSICEDEGLLAIKRQLTSQKAVVTTPIANVTGYNIQRTAPTISAILPINSSFINSEDPLGDGSEPVGSYEITYTSDPADDPFGCTNTAINTLNFNIVPQPDRPLLSNSLTGIGGIDVTDTYPLAAPNGDSDEYILEFCIDEIIPNLTVSGSSTDLVKWYQDETGTNELVDGDSDDKTFDWLTSPFGTNTASLPQVRTVYFSVTDNSTPAACESPLRKVQVLFRGENTSPQLDVSGASNGVELDNAGIYEYFFEYCADAGTTPTTDDIVFISTLENTRTYFNVYSDPALTTLLQTIQLGDPETASFDPTTFLGLDFTAPLIGTTNSQTFYITKVVSDNTAVIPSSEFSGCEGPATKVTYGIYTNPQQPAIANFDASGNPFEQPTSIINYYMCAGETLPDIQFETNVAGYPTEDGNNNFVFNWYDGGGNPIAVDDDEGIKVDLDDLMGATMPFDPNPANSTIYTFFTELNTNFNTVSGYVGCTSPQTTVRIHVFVPEVAPAVTGIPGDADETSIDLTLTRCTNDIIATEAINVVGNYVGTNDRYFKWYRATETGGIDGAALAIADPENATFSELGLAGQTTDGDFFFIVREVSDVIDEGDGIINNDPDNAFQGCESTGFKIAILVRENPQLNITNMVDGGDVFCANVSTFLPEVTDNGSPLTLNGSNSTYRVSSRNLPNTVAASTGDLPWPPPQLNFLSLHQSVGGTAFGGAQTLHELAVTYQNEDGCPSTVTTRFEVFPQPNLSFFGEVPSPDSEFISPSSRIYDYTETDVQNDIYEVCYDGGTVALGGIFFEADGDTALANSGIFSGTGLAAGFVVDGPQGEGSFNVKDAMDEYAQLTFGNPDTSRFVGADFRVNYEFTDPIAGCTNNLERIIRVHPAPALKQQGVAPADLIGFSSSCEGQPTIAFIQVENINEADLTFTWFVNNFEVPAAVQSGAGGNVFDAGLQSGTIFVGVLVTDNRTGCARFEFIEKAIGQQPKPSFAYANITENNPAGLNISLFEDSEVVPDDEIIYMEFQLTGGPTSVPIITRGPNQNGVSLNDIVLTGLAAGTYQATFRVITRDFCDIVTVTRTIPILPFVTLDENGYGEDFDSGPGGWIVDSRAPDGKSDVPGQISWELTNPSTLSFDPFNEVSDITTDASGSTTGNIWVTDADSTYYGNERSYVYSPAFDLSAISSPGISFNHIRDFDNFRDGVVLQISEDDGLTWKNVGGVDSGFDWYTNSGISSNPGDSKPDPSTPQSSGFNPLQIGFSEKNDTLDTQVWVTSRNALSGVNDPTNVRFRFALSSIAGEKANIDATNNVTDAADGFAFDNFSIFELDRVVLLEQFSSTQSQDSENNIQAILNNVGAFDPNQIVWINYFTDLANNESSDQLNIRNRVDPGARAAFYGVEQVPASFFSGVESTFITGDGQSEGDFKNELDLQKLIEPRFDVVNKVVSYANGRLQIDASFRANEDFDENTEVIFFAAVVEKEITTLNDGIYSPGMVVHYALRTLLPSAAGQYIRGPIQTDTSIDLSHNWQVNQVYNEDELQVIFFAQNYRTKEIYQAAAVDVGDITLPAVLGVADDLGRLAYTAYPNPSRGDLQILLNGPAPDDVLWQLIETSGRQVLEGIIPAGYSDPVALDIQTLRAGMYYLQLSTPGKQWPIKKIVLEE